MATGIARQLLIEENDVVVIDEHLPSLNTIRSNLDVATYYGCPAHPEVLEEACGSLGVDMLIAVTASDEVNMIACQMGYSLFDIPIKIARIKTESYLQPEYFGNLYSSGNIPIDFIISPSRGVAEAIVNRMRTPGSMDCLHLSEKLVQVVEVRCAAGCDVIGKNIAQIYQEYSHIIFSICGINREQSFLIPRNNDEIKVNDEVYFITKVENVRPLLAIFGHNEIASRNMLIIGGGKIGFQIAKSLEQDRNINSIKIIELSKKRAEDIAPQLERTLVLNADSMSEEILSEANLEAIDTVIAVTNDDEVNILSALHAKRKKFCQQVFALINKGELYNSLVSSLGIDVIINPSDITVSSILQHIRRGKVKTAFSIGNGKAEIIEEEVFKNSALVGKKISSIKFTDGILLSMIIRGGETILPNKEMKIQQDDKMVITCDIRRLKKLDKIFEERSEFF